MRKLGFIFIVISVVIGFISSIYPYSKCFYYGIGLAIVVFVSGIWAFMLHNAPEEMGMPTYDNPPAPPEPLIQCHKLSIDNSNKALAILELLREELKDIAPPKEAKCYKDCGDTKPYPRGKGSICLNCGSSIIKDEELEFLRPEFPKDRTE